MVWIRFARIKAVWRCYTTRGYTSKYHAVGAAIRDEYENRPTEDIDEWAKRLGDFVATKMCENSCQSLSPSIFCDRSSIQVDITYTSEILVGKAKKKIKRTLKFRAMFRCSKEEGKMTDGMVFRYKDYEITEGSEEFPQSLTKWRDDKLDETIRDLGKRCEDIGRKLFDYDIVDVGVSEEEI